MRFIAPTTISGRLRAPASKSVMQRAVLLASVAHGTTHIANPSRADDSLAALGLARSLGAQVTDEDGSVGIAGGGEPRDRELFCGESGFSLRAVTALAALYDRESIVTGSGSLVGRPVGMMEKPLRDLGASCSTTNGTVPITVRGPLQGGRTVVDGSTSSQFLSGLLMALPLCSRDSELTVTALKSRPYVGMTLELARLFGAQIDCDDAMTRFEIRGGRRYEGADVEVEGDWSGAAFLLVAGALAGQTHVAGLKRDSLQADRSIVDALEAARAKVTWTADGVTVCRDRLRGFAFDATDCPDLFPPLVALASACEGRSAIAGAGRLRHKESDRAAALLREFRGIGADIDVIGDVMEVTGGKLRGGEVQSHNDHRIVMACAVAALVSERGVSIEGETCVAKSYPEFFGDLESLGVLR